MNTALASKPTKSGRRNKTKGVDRETNRAASEQQVDETSTSKLGAAVAKPNKRDRLAKLLLRDEGATIDQMTEATGWLPHTVRTAISGLRKSGHGIESDRVDGVRTYRAVEPK